MRADRYLTYLPNYLKTTDKWCYKYNLLVFMHNKYYQTLPARLSTTKYMAIFQVTQLHKRDSFGGCLVNNGGWHFKCRYILLCRLEWVEQKEVARTTDRPTDMQDNNCKQTQSDWQADSDEDSTFTNNSRILFSTGLGYWFIGIWLIVCPSTKSSAMALLLCVRALWAQAELNMRWLHV